MADWLERARRQIPKPPVESTANTAERSVTAVLAVPKPGPTRIPASSIGSNGSTPSGKYPKSEPAVKATVTVLYAAHDDRPASTITQAVAQPNVLAFVDDRRFCHQCLNLTNDGLCLAARRGELRTVRTYHPIQELPHRCVGYAPKAGDTDRRPGRERWPGLNDE